MTDDEYVDGSDKIEVEGDMRQAQKILEHDGSYVLTKKEELVDNDYSIADVADLANSAAALMTVVVVTVAVVVAVLVVDND